MDNPLYAMLFAEDLIDYALKRNGVEWPMSSGVRRFREEIEKERFTDEIGEAVLDIMASKADSILSSYNTLVEQKMDTKDQFRFQASITTVYSFPTGYDDERFLHLCAVLAGVSLHFARKGNFIIADVSAQLLAYVLNFFIYLLDFEPRTAWFNLAYQAQRIRRRLLSTASNNNWFWKTFWNRHQSTAHNNIYTVGI